MKKKRQILRCKSKVHVCGGGGRGNIDRRHNMGFLYRKKMPSVSYRSVFRVIKDTLNVIVYWYFDTIKEIIVIISMKGKAI